MTDIQAPAETASPMITIPFPKWVYLWGLRLLLAILLLFGTEILLWGTPNQREWTAWLTLVPGYLALATFALDMAVRFRIRDVYDGLLICGMVAILNGLLLNPELTQADFPRTFMTRVMGGYLVFSAEMFGLFLILTAGFRARFQRLLLGYAIWLGFYWGVWMRWTPEFGGWFQETISLETMLAYSGVLITLIFVIFSFTTRYGRQNPIEPLDFRLSPLGWTLLVGAFLVEFILRVLEDAVLEAGAIPATLLVLLVCYAILWYKRTETGRMMLEWHIPPTPMSRILILIAIVVFFGMMVFGYQLDLIASDDINQLRIMEWLFVLVGFIWLPMVAISVAIPAIDRQWRRMDGG